METERMPQRKSKVMWAGKEHDATPIEVTSANEHWNNYLLEDGTSIKFKTTLVSVVRVEGAYGEDGNPVYLTKSQNIVAADAPDELRGPK